MYTISITRRRTRRGSTWNFVGSWLEIRLRDNQI